jgi:hypothetical protein
MSSTPRLTPPAPCTSPVARRGQRPILHGSSTGAEPRDGGFAPRVPLDGVNHDGPIDPDNPTASWNFNPEISPDGTILFFTSLRAAGHGFGDLHVAFRQCDGWSEPRNLGPPVNTADDEYHPTLSPDGGPYTSFAPVSPRRSCSVGSCPSPSPPSGENPDGESGSALLLAERR